MMKQHTAQKISRKSVEQMDLFFDTFVKEAILLCDIYSKHDKRKTISHDDVNLAIQTLFKRRV